ncbi:hypothetical protein GALL_118120 [mine drainage metagenome]|jgi:hypothetical protein|uniref:Uncharacterized protein n=1 Tax=mine drainage metagenome TaxID=410659 RepID=A0A1J5SCD0_9ZZZZ
MLKNVACTSINNFHSNVVNFASHQEQQILHAQTI